MPKKRSNLKQFQGSSSSSGKQSTANNGNNSPSVNERLSELRRLEGKDAVQKKAELAESSNARSVPPSLRGILGIPDSAPPKPKRGVRARFPDRTRTPGPAPPASWTKRPGWSPLMGLRTGKRRFMKSGAADDDRDRPDELMRFALMIDKHGEANDQRPPSLLHASLKTAAKQWSLFDEEDYPALTELPLRLRLRLITYIGFYGPALDIHEIEALTQGNESLSQLDLAGLIGHGNLNVSRLTKFAKQQAPKSDTSDEDVLESWDQDGTFEAALRAPPATTRFEHLTYLSLSHPGKAVSWRDLLSLSKQVGTLTHLSLAYWPRPTLTPNLSTATVTSRHSPTVAAGGSHFYSVLDQDMYEPAVILRQLSGNLLRLVWLDIEGCTEWVPALSYHVKAESTSHMPSRVDDWSSTSSATSVFLSNWKRLSYINCSQGWLPNPLMLRTIAYEGHLGSDVETAIVAKYVERMDSLKVPYPCGSLEIHRSHARAWLDMQIRASSTERKINALRRSAHLSHLEFDHGWRGGS